MARIEFTTSDLYKRSNRPSYGDNRELVVSIVSVLFELSVTSWNKYMKFNIFWKADKDMKVNMIFPVEWII